MTIIKYCIYILIIIIIIIILLNIHTAIIKYKNKTIEVFNDIELPFKLNSSNLFIEDSYNLMSKIDDIYWKFMNHSNILARGYLKLDEMVDQYRKNSLQNITNEEKKYIINNIELNVKTFIYTNQKIYNYLKYWCSQIKIAKSSKWLESGMPHTHNNIIILNESAFNSSFQFSTFLHEIIHIHQRKYPQDWNELILSLRFQNYNFLDNPSSGLENILLRNRTNPDGLDINYLWCDPITNKHYWIGTIYSTIIPVSLINDMQYIACHMQIDNAGMYKYTGTMINLNNFNNFNNFFGITNNNYHPNEIIAEYINIYIGNYNYNNYDGYKLFKIYIDDFILAKY